jgi:hypothetical protein
MNLKIEISLLVLGGILRILCVGWNFYYCFKSEFYFDDFRAICFTFIAAPSALFIIITIILISIDIFKCRFNKVLFKIGLGLLIAVGGPLGAPLFVYAVLLAINDSRTGDFHIIDSIARVTSLIESLFESLPQIALQIYNNNKMQLWNDNLKMISIILSVFGIFYTIYKLCSSVDKVQMYESAVSLKIRPSVTNEKVSTSRKSNINSDLHNDNHVSDLEVYEMGEEVD